MFTYIFSFFFLIYRKLNHFGESGHRQKEGMPKGLYYFSNHFTVVDKVFVYWESLQVECTLLLCIVGLQLTTLLLVSTADAQRFYAKLHLVAQLITLDFIEKSNLVQNLQASTVDTKLLAIESLVESLNSANDQMHLNQLSNTDIGLIIILDVLIYQN